MRDMHPCPYIRVRVSREQVLAVAGAEQDLHLLQELRLSLHAGHVELLDGIVRHRRPRAHPRQPRRHVDAAKAAAPDPARRREPLRRRR